MSALDLRGLIARASSAGYDSSLISTSGWSAGIIIVPEDFRVPRRGRRVRLLERERPSSSPSEEFREVWFDSAVVMVGAAVEGSAREGVALASVLLMVLVDIVDAIVGSWAR